MIVINITGEIHTCQQLLTAGASLLVWFYLPQPALLFLLIVVCPYFIVFWATSWSLHVGLLFWSLQLLTWRKWFSTKSWFMMAGLITACGYSLSLMDAMAWKPRTIDCRSNQSLLEKKFSNLPSVRDFHWVRKKRNCVKSWSLGSEINDNTNLSWNSSITLDVCLSSSMLASTPSLPRPCPLVVRCPLYACDKEYK